MAHDPYRTPAGATLPPDARIGAVVSTYHAELTGAMLDSARRTLQEAGLAHEIDVVWVPGSFELPLVARRLAARDDVDAVLCIGVILKGETRHDEYIARGVVDGLVRASFETDTPCILGVLTCETLDQARARALRVAMSNSFGFGGHNVSLVFAQPGVIPD